MAKKKIETEKVIEVPKDFEEIEVTNINEAEKLQKSGWQLIDCHLTPEGKVYKFKKGK